MPIRPGDSFGAYQDTWRRLDPRTGKISKIQKNKVLHKNQLIKFVYLRYQACLYSFATLLYFFFISDGESPRSRRDKNKTRK